MTPLTEKSFGTIRDNWFGFNSCETAELSDGRRAEKTVLVSKDVLFFGNGSVFIDRRREYSALVIFAKDETALV